MSTERDKQPATVSLPVLVADDYVGLCGRLSEVERLDEIVTGLEFLVQQLAAQLPESLQRLDPTNHSEHKMLREELADEVVAILPLGDDEGKLIGRNADIGSQVSWWLSGREEHQVRDCKLNTIVYAQLAKQYGLEVDVLLYPGQRHPSIMIETPRSRKAGWDTLARAIIGTGNDSTYLDFTVNGALTFANSASPIFQILTRDTKAAIAVLDDNYIIGKLMSGMRKGHLQSSDLLAQSIEYLAAINSPVVSADTVIGQGWRTVFQGNQEEHPDNPAFKIDPFENL